jgi:hypothetical protein
MGVAAVGFGLLPSAWAQVSGGNVYGTVSDPSGAVLLGATVTIASSVFGGATRSTTTGSDGEFRFLNLDHGTYQLTASLTGFSKVARYVIVNTGVNVSVKLSLKVAVMEELVNVKAETPVVDTHRVGTATTLTSDDLRSVPQGRDPWAVLRSVPGVLVDRVSVAGNEAGQQSLFVSKGAQQNDTTWNLDGVVITDTTSYGGSSTYFDFDSFDEVNVTTGGNDLKNPTGGIGLNFVTKRGTNTFHGSLHDYFSNHKYGESENTPSSVTSGLVDNRADQIRQISDYGADLGGPIIKDKLWFWGSYGKNDIRLYRFINESQDKTVLINWNAKVNWQASPNDMVSFFFNRGAKDKYGRDPGLTGHDANSILLNQRDVYPSENCGLPCWLHGLFKLELNHTLSTSLFVNAKYAYFSSGHGLVPVGGPNQDASINHITDSAKGSWATSRSFRPWHTANLDGEYFAHGLGGRNELKFGFGYRHWPTSSSVHFSGDGLVGIVNNDNATDPLSSVAWVTRPSLISYTGYNYSGYVGDSYTRSRVTLNVGFRFDHQNAHNDASTAAASPALPNVLPALTFDGKTPAVNWNDWSPRVGVTVALDDARKTVLRASYARYAGQLGPPDATLNSPIPFGYTYLAYRWVDLNHDGLVQRDEILTNQGVLYAGLVDPLNPASATTLNTIDPKYHANHDNEVIVGIEREIAKDFSVGVAYTYRRGDSLVDWLPRIGINGNIFTTANYTALPPVTANGYKVVGYTPIDVGRGAFTLTNRPDYHQTYSGAEVTAHKRLSNRWMFRAAFTLQSWTEHFDGPNAFQNPTPTDGENFGGNVTRFGGPHVDGGIVANQSYGAKTNTFISANWQISSSVLYQLGAGFELSASLLGRQGYPKAISVNNSLGADGTVNEVVGPLDLQRYDNVWDVDMRLAKNIKLGGSGYLGISLDAFNLLNCGAVLQQSRVASSLTFGQPIEILNPRILRLGVRLGF